MSDVPELDRLIEQHEVFQRNMAWERMERFQTFGFRCQVCAVIAAAIVLFVGPIGLAALPLAWPLAVRFVPEPKRRDPFARYRVR